MATFPYTVVATAVPADNKTALEDAMDSALNGGAGDGDLIDIDFDVSGTAGVFDLTGVTGAILWDARNNGGGNNEPLNRSIRVRPGASPVTIQGGFQPFLVQKLGEESDFDIEDITFKDPTGMAVHLRGMRNARIVGCTVEFADPVGDGVPPKTFNGQVETEIWGLKCGCYMYGGGPSGNVLIKDNVVDMYTGVYAGGGEEDCCSKAIQTMVCPETSRITIVGNTVRHAAVRGISVVDTRGTVQVYDNTVEMNAPYYHKGDQSKYHFQGEISGSGISFVNGYNTEIYLPIDNGKVDFYDNAVEISMKDMLGIQVQGIDPTKVGPISFRKNTVVLLPDGADNPYAAALVHGIDNASLTGNTFSGDAQVGLLIGCLKAEAENGTAGVSLSNTLKDLVAEHGVMAFLGADAERCALVGTMLGVETVQFPRDALGTPLPGSNYATGYYPVPGDIPAGLATILANLDANGIGVN